MRIHVPEFDRVIATIPHENYKKALSLINGAMPVVEMFKCESPSQIEWKKCWLEKARELLND